MNIPVTTTSAPAPVVEETAMTEIPWTGCDAKECPARALVHVFFSEDRELHFCGHHANEHAGYPTALDVVDERLEGKELVSTAKHTAAFA